MTSSLFDTDTVTRTALFGGAETWFDAVWYPAAPEVRQGRIAKAARLLRDRVVAMRIHRPEKWADLGETFAMTAATGAAGRRS